MSKMVLCGASAYEKKYYFNEAFARIPKRIQEELHIICVLFTEEVGGVLTLCFNEEGDIVFETHTEEDDIYYDEISAGLLIREIREKRRDMLASLQTFYQVFILGTPEERAQMAKAFLDEEA